MSTPSVITIGNFDGVHRGHQAILARARRLADTHRARVVALCFDPHPAAVLRPGSEPPRLTATHEKITRLKAFGADEVTILEPNKALLSRTPEQFVDTVVQKYHPVAVVEGADFRFGKGRAGDVETLAALGRQHGFELAVQPAVEAALTDMLIAPVSSSLIRWLIGRGRVADAAICLGAPFSLTGPVAPGEQRGRTLGIPTANLDPEAYAHRMTPMDGVYAGSITINNTTVPPASRAVPGPGSSPGSHPAAISVGVKPTFGQHQLAIEAHLLDFAGDLYGRTITIHFTHWLRDQLPFPNVETLKIQMDRDITETRLAASSRVRCADLL